MIEHTFLIDVVEKKPESEAVVRFQDCDPFSHLNNSKYIDYFINAREDHLLRYYQFDIFKIAKETGLGWVVAQHQIAYLAAARLMEKIIIQTRLISCTDNALMVESLMFDSQKSRVKCVMWTHYVHFNLAKLKVETHAEEYKKLLESIVCPFNENKTFEGRMEEIKKGIT